MGGSDVHASETKKYLTYKQQYLTIVYVVSNYTKEKGCLLP